LETHVVDLLLGEVVLLRVEVEIVNCFGLEGAEEAEEALDKLRNVRVEGCCVGFFDDLEEGLHGEEAHFFSGGFKARSGEEEGEDAGELRVCGLDRCVSGFERAREDGGQDASKGTGGDTNSLFDVVENLEALVPDLREVLLVL
jgi:hypothetical protein